jgi:hypothetical protein
MTLGYLPAGAVSRRSGPALWQLLAQWARRQVCACGETIYWRADPGAWSGRDGIILCASVGQRAGGGRLLCHEPAVMRRPRRSLRRKPGRGGR